MVNREHDYLLSRGRAVLGCLEIELGIEIVNGFDTERRKPKGLRRYYRPLLTTASQARQRATGVDPVAWPFS
jgi:hypothetical protein